MDRLRRELDDARNELQRIGKSKGDEVSSLLMKFNREKAELEAALNEKQALIDEFLQQLEEQQGEADHIRRVRRGPGRNWKKKKHGPILTFFSNFHRFLGKRRGDCCAASWHGRMPGAIGRLAAGTTLKKKDVS